MRDIKITIVGRKHYEYLDDEMLDNIWILLEPANPMRRRAILYKLLIAAHTNGRRQTATEMVRRGNSILSNMELLAVLDKEFGFLADAPVVPVEVEDE